MISMPDDETLVLVYCDDVVIEVNPDQSIELSNFTTIPKDMYRKEDFHIFSATEVVFNTVTQYAHLLGLVRRCNRKIKYGMSTEGLAYITFDYDEDWDQIDFVERNFNRVQFFKLSDVTKSKIDLFWGEDKK